jgi:hypothetical protein
MVSEDFLPIGTFSGIYLLIFNSGLFYIGSSSNINKRIVEHTRILRNKKHYNKKLQEQYDLNPVFQSWCIEKVEDTSTLFEVEQKYLDKYSPPLNIAIDASSPKLTPKQVHEKQGGSRNHMAKITLDDAMCVVVMRNAGYTLKDIALNAEVTYPIVCSICSGHNWEKELSEHFLEEYLEMRSNKHSLGISNRKSHKPSNRLFDVQDIREIFNKVLAGDSLTSIANYYNTSKTVISSIKRFKCYIAETQEVLTPKELLKIQELNSSCK